MQRNLNRIVSKLTVLVVGFILLWPLANNWAGPNSNPRIVPPHAHSHGKSYGDWAALWWQWALSIPANSNPLIDPTGEFAGVGQSGPVWFIAGTFGDDFERTIRVPPGKTLFVPVFNWLFGAAAADCSGADCVEAELRESAAAGTESATVLEISIDGKQVQGIRNYRAKSPSTFAIQYPEGSVTGFPSGRYSPNVADGYWVMLNPLTPGQHEIRTRVVSSLGFEFTGILHIHVGR